MIRNRARRRAAWVTVIGLLLAACTSSATSDVPTSTTGAGVPATTPGGTYPTGIEPGYADVNEVAPLVITSLTPDPIPFTGTDGKVHLAYEVQVLNASPRTATLTRVETLADGPDGPVLATLSGDEITARTLVVGDAAGEISGSIPGGRVALVLLDDVYGTRADVPAERTHRISATFTSSPDDDRLTQFYPTEVTQFGGLVTTSAEAPPTIGPPITGGGWVTTGTCCTLAGHRGFVMPIGGRLNGTERFALELIKIDVTATPLVDEQAGTFASFSGDPTLPESYLAFDQEALAVADGTVIAVVSSFEDRRPVGSFAEGLSLEDTTGNYVIIDIGNGVSAISNHLKQGSPTVQVGDAVTKGEVIGRIGNSGNSSQPHLHFQLFRGPAALAGDNLPFQIDRFDFDGTMTIERLDRADAGPRTQQYPLSESITSYADG